MMPARVLWGMFATFEWVMGHRFIRNLQPIRDQIQNVNQLIWDQFAQKRVVTWYLKPVTLLPITGIATLIGFGFSILLWGIIGAIMAVLGNLFAGAGFFRFLISLIITGIFIMTVYSAVAFLLESYGLEVNKTINRGINYITQKGNDIIRE